MYQYIQTDEEIRDVEERLGSVDSEAFRRISTLLFATEFSKVERKLYHSEPIPRHGPGATADRLLGNQKWNQRTWPARLNQYFPIGEYLIPNPRYFEDLERVDLLEPWDEIPAKVISVPKTLKTPRIIAREPTAMQYAQQAVLREILDSLKESKTLSKMLGFDDQTPNQRMAREGSLSGSLATLDLSEASDRVSRQRVSDLLSNFPELHGRVMACRSFRAQVLDKVLHLNKFASMGSALCFPMEAMVFLTCVFHGIEKDLNRHLTRADVQHYSRKVRIYGDDIIIPVEHVHTVISSLELFGAKVNERKSFWNGKFRESCGKEYYDGSDVSIVRCRQVFPKSRQDATQVISLVSLRNQLYFAGCWGTVRWLDDRIRKILKYFPTVAPTSRVLGRHSLLGFSWEGLDPNTHAPVVKGYAVSALPPSDMLEGSAALLKCLVALERGDQREEEWDVLAGQFTKTATDDNLFNRAAMVPINGAMHLERSGRPRRVDIKPGRYSAV